MNIAAIQTFLAVVRTGNLNRAAAALNVTQSAVTARLDSLEAALGATLLNRSRKGATLTKAGYAFLDRAEVIVSAWDGARALVGLPSGVTRLFSLVCAPGLWHGLADDWLASVRAAHPGTAVETWAGLETDARRWLQSGLSDAALLPQPLAGAEFDSRLFGTDRLVQVSTHTADASPRDPDYVFVDYGPTFRTQHAKAWPGDTTAAISFSNPDWALAHLLAHGGSAYLPDRLARADIAAGRLIAVPETPAVDQPVYLSWLKAGTGAFPWLAAPG